MECSDTTRTIFALLVAHRRVLGDWSPTQDDTDRVFETHGPVIERCVAQGKPLHAILPAFPCKSPSLSKVLGRLPDGAERQSLKFLDDLFRRIAAVHAPGARLTICSDGRVFADCLDVADEDISAYRDVLAAMCATEGLRHIDFFQLEDVVGYARVKQDPTALRAMLDRDYGHSLDVTRETLLATRQGLAMYNGVTRFMLEDRATEVLGASRTSAQKVARARALWTIARSEAWGRLLAAHWPEALRLSIHPQVMDSPKLGIRLLETRDDWLTPWHATLIEEDGRYRLAHRCAVDDDRYALVEEDGRPSHFRPRAGDPGIMPASQS